MSDRLWASGRLKYRSKRFVGLQCRFRLGEPQQTGQRGARNALRQHQHGAEQAGQRVGAQRGARHPPDPVAEKAFRQ